MAAVKAADVQLVVEIAGAHQRSRGIYGSPRVHRELRARGVRVGKKRVERLMRERGLQGRRKRRFCRTTDSNHAHPVAPNVLERYFETQLPNEAWVGDVTYIATDEGWLYLAVLLDLFSRRVVGWATSATNDRSWLSRRSTRRCAVDEPGPDSCITPTAAAPTPATTTALRSPNEASSRA